MKNAPAKKILVVEDDLLFRRSLACYFGEKGYTILEAEDGRQGLQIFHKEQPDLVLTDLRMPEMDGLDLLAQVVEESPDTPVIVLSGMGTMTDAIDILQIGAWDYLTKPVRDLGLLQHAVEQALERATFLGGVRDSALPGVSRRSDTGSEDQIEESHGGKDPAKKLQLAKRQWKKTIDAIPAPVFLVDRDHRLLMANTAMADVLDIVPDGAIGKRCSFCIHDDNHITEKCAQDKLVSQEQPPHGVEACERAPEENMELKVFPYYDVDDQTLLGSVHIIRRQPNGGKGERVLKKIIPARLFLSALAEYLWVILTTEYVAPVSSPSFEEGSPEGRSLLVAAKENSYSVETMVKFSGLETCCG